MDLQKSDYIIDYCFRLFVILIINFVNKFP